MIPTTLLLLHLLLLVVLRVSGRVSLKQLLESPAVQLSVKTMSPSVFLQPTNHVRAEMCLANRCRIHLLLLLLVANSAGVHQRTSTFQLIPRGELMSQRIQIFPRVQMQSVRQYWQRRFPICLIHSAETPTTSTNRWHLLSPQEVESLQVPVSNPIHNVKGA